MADANPLADENDVQLQMPQDDFDTSAQKTDPLIPELTGDASKELGVPAGDLARELKDIAFDEEGRVENDEDNPYDGESAREAIEDKDQDMGEAGKR